MTGGKQDISLAWNQETGAGCYANAAVHEMGHAIGLAHEQSRSDRDDFVTIHWENMEESQKYNFDKTNFQSMGRYDLHSIMQYPWNAFSKNGKATMTAKDNTPLEYPNGLSDNDAAQVREYYAAELQRAPAKAEPASTVVLTWPGVYKNNTTYSLDIQRPDGSWIGPCVDSGMLKWNATTIYAGTCPSHGEVVPLPTVKTFRVCWTQNEDWPHATCQDKKYSGETALHIAP